MAVFLATTSACNPPEDSIEPRPRPVTFQTLKKGEAPDAALVSASVGSWKTEDIGFEVGGRVEFVAEPNTAVEGRVFDKQGELIVEGTPIGRLENERYRLRVEQAKADVAQAEQNLIAANVELNDTIPAQIAAAVATRTLAKTEYDRSVSLFKQNAGSEGEMDRAKSEYENALAQIRQLDASVKAKQAEIKSLDNRVKQFQQSLRDAERDLEDCTLFASFRGQVADISVVPGSVVNAGQAVLKLQMMNPIKVELEVSAEQSRQLERTRILPVHFATAEGAMAKRDGYLYQIDPVADPETRTFTVTLLILNEKSANDEEQAATTDDIWRLDFGFLPGSDGTELFVDEKALLQDEQGPYLWQITNATTHSNPPPDRLLKVRRLRVALGPLKIPYLGSYVFQQVVVDDPEFEVGKNLVAGKLTVADGTPEQWNGDSIRLVTDGQWMLRPGDLVQVDLSSRDTDGIYVPMDAIVRKGSELVLFTLEGENEAATVKALPIVLAEDSEGPTSSLRRIESADGSSLEGLRYVNKGAHYLIDGETVRVVCEVKDSQ
ncbi:MAG: HlyD family efflux transporter periplasmic adaptor subunit [Planctomycetota bacterium]